MTPCSDVVGYQRFSLKMEGARFSETLVCYHITTLRHNPAEHDMNLHHRENMKSWIGRNLHFR